MNVLTVYLRIYADAFRQALAGIGKNAWTLLLPIALLILLNLGRGVLAAIGLGGWVGGILFGLLLCALVSCYLYFDVFFVYFIVSYLLGALVRGHQGAVLQVLLRYGSIILLNAAPEVIYQRGSYGGLETVQRAIRFLQANWIEWGIPNLLVVGAWYLLDEYPLPRLGVLGDLLVEIASGALIHVVMVFRGHLFKALDGTSHRQRMYRYRSSGAV
jgi:hypothetical protein